MKISKTGKSIFILHNDFFTCQNAQNPSPSVIEYKVEENNQEAEADGKWIRRKNSE